MPTVRSADAEIHYDVTGDGAPMLLVMGLGADSRGWTLQVPPFSERYRVITFDNRGVGRSSTPPGRWSTEQMARDALAVLDAAGAERAHVVGVSMGGAISQHLALLAPGRVRSLVLACTWPGPSEWRTRLRRMQLAIANGSGLEDLVRSRLLFIFSPATFANAPRLIDVVEQRMIEDGGTSLEGYLRQLDAAEEHDVRARLGEVRAPTLALAGRRDILVPPELTEEIAALIPGARLEYLDAAHAMQLEATQRFNELVLAFVSAH